MFEFIYRTPWYNSNIPEENSGVNNINDDVMELPISIPLNDKDNTLIYSSYSCTGNINREAEYRNRICLFRNVCYDKKKEVIVYYKPKNSPKRPVLFEAKHGLIYDFYFGKRGFVQLQGHSTKLNTWHPIIVDEHIPLKNVKYLQSIHVLWNYWHLQEFNLGHLLWEDIASIYSSMIRLNVYTKNVIVMNVNNRESKKRTIYSIFFSQILPSFVKKYVTFSDYMKQFHEEFICFKNLLAGGNIALFNSDKGILGQEKIYYDFRTIILKHHGVDLKRPPTRHLILLVNKSHSEWGERNGIATRRSIYNLNEIKSYLQKTYKNIEIKVVKLHRLSFPEQIKLMYKTTIIITPCGGISATIPFLPRGAHAIIMDFYNTKKHRGWNPGESGSMEGYVWNYFPHFKKLYYQVRDESDYIMDLPNTTNTRDYASIIVNMSRLKMLVDTAIENSAFSTL
ncbi:unnamed protein product [Didymodactylos carnosus]|uniref:Glycosyltransferase 61 catalytic domain-containing protein n=1 Tax=Didymodactylos carnosus TaxID=1234261 RepID=A0A815H6N4_9BILA|nr:unnamed protein product [Didymodactylos carnosus]CAF1349941.1 unnamed protein product [Didymodactylos carnosus]CAF4014352.1 unnamed protein product [Didymodactylos carnosus]CAF4219150.1 unnamed protein product [Didymodactylos carnosus]